MTTPKIIAIVLLTAGALALSAGAKVFWNRPAASGHAVLAATPGWETVATSKVRINDGQGDLVVIGCHEALGEVMAALRRAYAACKILEPFRHNETMGWARVCEGGAVVTLLALAPNAPEQALLFVLTQAAGDFEKSRGPPQMPRLSDPPPYPGSRVQTYLTSAESQMQLEIYSAAAGPEAIRQHYAGVMSGQSWSRLDPAGDAGAVLANMAIYQKDSALCVLLVIPAAGRDESAITVLHKRLKIE